MLKKKFQRESMSSSTSLESKDPEEELKKDGTSMKR